MLKLILIVTLIMTISALTGWITNKICILLLFRPYNKKKFFNFNLPFTPGIFSRRKNILAKKIGEVSKKNFIENNIGEYIANHIMNSIGLIDSDLKILISQNIEYFINNVKLNKMIETKINEFKPEDIEKIIRNVSNKELKAIERLGGLIGLFTGIISSIITYIII